GGVKRDTTLGYTLVDLNNLGHKVYLFILASQARQVFYVKDQIDKKNSIVFKTLPKNYKDKYDEVDEEFSIVIHQHNDNILPRVDRRDLGDESRNDYYQTDYRVQGLSDYYGYDNIEDYLSDFYFPSTDKEDTIVHTGPVCAWTTKCDTWDDILKKLRMRTPRRCADKWMNDSSDDTKGVSSKGPSITSIPKEGTSIASLSKEPIPNELLAWYGYDIIKDYLPVAKKPIQQFIFKRPIPIKRCMLGLANVETWDNIVKKF
ncbi:transposon ty3-G gag-pol polyprotein, partial [Tanacetum coccineum]